MRDKNEHEEYDAISVKQLLQIVLKCFDKMLKYGKTNPFGLSHINTLI